MALSASALGSLLVSKMSAGQDVKDPAALESFATALAEAIVEHITAAAEVTVTIPPSSINTTGSAAAQSGPPAPVDVEGTIS